MILLEVEPLDLGTDVKAIGLELIEAETREPVVGEEGARVWSRVLHAVAAADAWGFDFISHLERVRDYCRRHAIPFREAGPHFLFIAAMEDPALSELILRFAGETFGVRAGARVAGPAPDAALEGDLAHRGMDAYHHRYPEYTFCAVCDFENGFLTILTNRLWASEVVRRVQPVLRDLAVTALIPQ